MEFPRSSLQAMLSYNEESLAKFRKDLLYPHWKEGQYNEPPNPDQVVALTWGQIERFFAIYQSLMTGLQYEEDRRLRQLQDNYMKAL